MKTMRTPHPSAEILESRIAPASFFVDGAADFVVTTDVAPAGLSAGDTVTWNPGVNSLFGGAATGLVFGTDAFSTIQSAVDASTGGFDDFGAFDVIRVAPGTYPESVVLSKAVRIEGNKLNIGTTPPASQSTISSATSGFKVAADHVLINGFTFTGNTDVSKGAVLVSDPSDGSVRRFELIRSRFEGNAMDVRMSGEVAGVFEDNVIVGAGDAAVFGNASDAFSLSRNTFEGSISIPGDAGISFSDNTFANGTITSVGAGSRTFVNNAFTGVTLALTVNSLDVIRGNTFDNSFIELTAPVQANLGGRVTVENNTFTAGVAAVGIHVGGGFFADAPALIRGNVMHGFGEAAIRIGGDSPVTASANELSQNTLAVKNLGTIETIARFSFFGASDAAGVAAKVSGPVDTVRFVATDTDGSFEDGWQPVLDGIVSFPKPNTATYTDGDGDTVTIKTSKGRLSDDLYEFAVSRDGLGAVLSRLSFFGGASSIGAGANITITAKIAAGKGNNLTEIGSLNSSVALGTVKVSGDLGGFSAPFTKAISATTLGAGEAAGGDISTTNLGKLTVAGDVLAEVSAFSAFGKKAIGTVKIGGSLTARIDLISASGENQEGSIRTTGSVGKITVGGSLSGFAGGGRTGSIEIGGNSAGIKIGGDVSQGASELGGRILVDEKVAFINIGGDLRGQISARTLTALKIGGNILTSRDGAVEALTLGSMTVGGDVQGGEEALDPTIDIFGSAKSIAIGGKFLGRTQVTTDPDPASTGSIRIGGQLGSLTITDGIDAEIWATIQVDDRGGNSKVPAIGKITIGGDMRNADFQVGSANPDASVKSIVVAGRWVNSNFALNVFAGADELLTTTDDQPFYAAADGDPKAVGRIASITVKLGFFAGLTPGEIASATRTGISAPLVQAILIGKTKVPLTTSGDTLQLDADGLVFVREA